VVVALVAALMLTCPGRPASSKLPSASRKMKTEKGTTPFVEIASRAMPWVVNISIENPRAIIPGLKRNPLEKLFRKNVVPQLPEAETKTLGSGVVIDPRGFILTNYHVVREVEGISVRLADGRLFKRDRVKIVGTDAKSDLAVLKLEGAERLPAAEFGNSDSLRIGDWAIAIGDPFGLSGSVTLGVISATGRSRLAYPDAPSYQDFIQTDAAINPGNSGGPLLNARGELIGINTAIQSTVQANIGIGFAIPINSARRVADQLMRKGKVTRGYLGLTLQEITPSLKEALGLETSDGVMVGSVVKGSPAERAGIKAEDVITHLDSVPFSSVEHLRTTVSELAPGRAVTLAILRGAERLNIKVKLSALPESPMPEEAEPVERGVTALGLTVRDLTKAEQKQTGQKHGAKVVRIDQASAAAQAGVLVDDIIFQLDRRSITDAKRFAALAKPLENGAKSVTIQLLRGKTRYSISFTP
jgi:serine protease Do/serine protease DegQ